MSPRVRFAIVLVAVVGLIVAFAVASASNDDDDGGAGGATTVAATQPPATTVGPSAAGQETAPAQTTSAAPAIPTVEGGDAKPKGGIERLEFDKGATIRFRVRSDVADEIHVHGYDVAKDVPAGGSVTFSIPATIDGRFEVELESRGVQIAELEVQP
jgi:hypothetical protein